MYVLSLRRVENVCYSQCQEQAQKLMNCEQQVLKLLFIDSQMVLMDVIILMSGNFSLMLSITYTDYYVC